MKVIKTLLFILTFCSVVHAQNKEIKTLVANINDAVKNNSVENILNSINPENKKFFSKYQDQLENMIKLEDLSYSLEMVDLIENNGSMEAVVFEKIDHVKYERGLTEPSWKTIKFIKKNKKWMIDDIIERDYMKSVNAEISSTLDPDNQKVSATAKVEIEIVEGGENNLLFWLNRDLVIDEIIDESGASIPFSRSNLAVIIPWKKMLNKGDKISLEFIYSGSFFNEFKELGYSLVHIGKEGCFANFVTEWYPKVNGTLTKSKAKLFYTVPKELTVASVGKFIGKSVNENLVTYEYQVTKPMDYTFNANKFIEYRNEINGVQVNVFLLNGTQEKAEMYAKKSSELVAFLTNLYGVFPGDSYNISEVPAEITMELGGSGGQGLNFYPTNKLRDDVFEFPLFAHEIGHIWWGGLVNSDSKSGFVMSEGFSQLNAVLSYRYFYGEQAMWDFVNNGGEYYGQSARMYFTYFNDENDVPIGVYDENKSNEITRLSYLKPHIVLTMLMETIGYPEFVQGIKRIISEYANKRLTVDAIKTIMEEESGTNLDYFFDQWFYKASAPEFKMNHTIKQTESGRYLVEGDINQIRDVFQVSAEIQMSNDKYSETKRLMIDSKQQKFSFLLNFKPQSVVFDPDRKILRWSSDVNHLFSLGLAINDVFSGKSEESITQLKEFLNYNPFDITAHAMIGKAYMDKEEYTLAQEHFMFVINEFKTIKKETFEVVIAYTNQAQIFNKNGNHKKAKEYFSRVLKMASVMGSHKKAHEYLEKNH